MSDNYRGRCIHGQMPNHCQLCDRERIAELEDELDMDLMQSDIGIWGRKTFDHDERDVQAIFCHLVKEAKELHKAIESGTSADEIGEECADIFILMCSIAYLTGFSLKGEVVKKMRVNKSRAWGEPDKDGVIEHVSTEQPITGTCGGKKYIVSFRSFNGYAVIDQATGDAVKCWLSASDAIALRDRLNSEHSRERANNGRMNEEA